MGFIRIALIIILLLFIQNSHTESKTSKNHAYPFYYIKIDNDENSYTNRSYDNIIHKLELYPDLYEPCSSSYNHYQISNFPIRNNSEFEEYNKGVIYHSNVFSNDVR
jgi:hypothetical protein